MTGQAHQTTKTRGKLPEAANTVETGDTRATADGARNFRTKPRWTRAIRALLRGRFPFASTRRQIRDLENQNAQLAKKLDKITAKVETLRQRESKLRDHLNQVRADKEYRRQFIHDLLKQKYNLEQEVEKLTFHLKKSRSHEKLLENKLDLATKRENTLKNNVEKLRERVGNIRQFQRNAPVNLYLNFANNAHDIADQLAADVCIAHGVHALPAAEAVARAQGCKLFCDVIEIPSFANRALPVNWHPTNLSLLDGAFESYLRGCDGLTTIGWSLKDRIAGYGPPVTVVPNYRYTEQLAPSNRLREWCGLAPSDELVLSISTIASGMDDVIRGLAKLRKTVHLAQMGPIVPQEHDERIRNLIAELGLEDRVHFFDQVPYDELTTTASSADLGLIIRDPEILNNYISLPNRVFDYLFSGLPICAPHMPDISGILETRDVGAVVRPASPTGWANAIREVLKRREQMRRNALQAANEMTWESLEDGILSCMGTPRSVTFFGVNDLTKNNRTHRIARSLAKQGVTVKICTRTKDEVPSGEPVDYYIMP